MWQKLRVIIYAAIVVINPGKVRITSVNSSKYFKADINLVIVEY